MGDNSPHLAVASVPRQGRQRPCRRPSRPAFRIHPRACLTCPRNEQKSLAARHVTGATTTRGPPRRLGQPGRLGSCADGFRLPPAPRRGPIRLGVRRLGGATTPSPLGREPCTHLG